MKFPVAVLITGMAAMTPTVVYADTDMEGDVPARWTAAEREDLRRYLNITTIDAVKTTPEAREAMRRHGRPVALYRGTPAYPKEQARRGVQGCVMIGFDIRPDGKTDEFEILKSEPPGVFDDLAVRSIYATEFEPVEKTIRFHQILFFFIDEPVIARHSKLNRLGEEKRRQEQAQLEKLCSPRESVQDNRQ